MNQKHDSQSTQSVPGVSGHGSGRGGSPLADAAAPGHPTQIGPYKILETLGEGGMGIVYLAEQTAPIHRRVALKIIKAGMDTRQVVARFETEREALALMNHPNVAKVIDAGSTEQGRPYFAMEYVQGIPITNYCDKHRLNTEERLRLFIDVCHAVQHAHQKGIIHRDIKPSNVLIALQDEKPVPKVIDFGVAKATQHRLTEQTLFTEHGQLIGTPGYMSPEQAEMTALDIDTRTDIYALGVLLYELLVGSLPFDTDRLLQAGLAEIQRIIREVDPPKPSTRLSAMNQPHARGRASPATGQNAQRDGYSAPVALETGVGSGTKSSIQTIATARRTEPKRLIRQLRGDLDWVVMKCLEKDRTRRYDTANGLALEIGRFLNQELVLARPPSAAYRFKKFLRRNRNAVVAGACVFIVLIAGLAGTTYGLSNAIKAQRAAVSAKEAEARINEFLTKDLLGSIDPNRSRGREITVREVLDKAAKKIDHIQDSPATEASVRLSIGSAYYSLGKYDEAETHYKEALQLSNQIKNQVLAADVYEKLANLRFDEKKFDASLDLLNKSLAIRTSELGPKHPRTIETKGNLEHARGSVGKTEITFEKMLAEAWGPSLALAASTRDGPAWPGGPVKPTKEEAAASIAKRVEQLDEAWRKGEREKARDIVRTTILDSQVAFSLGTLNFFPIETLVNWHIAAAGLLRQDGRLPVAEAYLDGIIAFSEDRPEMGSHHLETIQAIEEMALVYRAQRRLGDATAFYCKGLNGRRRIQGTNHTEVVKATGRYKEFLLAVGDQRTVEQSCPHE